MQSVSYAYCSYRSAQDILPSFLRKGKAVSSSEKNTGKRTKSIQVWDRDILTVSLLKTSPTHVESTAVSWGRMV